MEGERERGAEVASAASICKPSKNNTNTKLTFVPETKRDRDISCRKKRAKKTRKMTPNTHYLKHILKQIQVKHENIKSSLPLTKNTEYYRSKDDITLVICCSETFQGTIISLGGFHILSLEHHRWKQIKKGFSQMGERMNLCSWGLCILVPLGCVMAIQIHLSLFILVVPKSGFESKFMYPRLCNELKPVKSEAFFNHILKVILIHFYMVAFYEVSFTCIYC